MNEPNTINTETNVIQFPKSKMPNKENLFADERDEMEMLTEMICSCLLESVEASGFHTNDDTVIKEICFAMESIRALLCKYYKIDHSFHDLARHSFTIVNENLVFTNPTFERKIEIESKD